MELPEELLLVICEHLQPPRYEDEATLNYYARRRAAHRPAAAVKVVSRGFHSLMTRTARVARASDYRSWAEFAAQTHRHAELFEGSTRARRATMTSASYATERRRASRSRSVRRRFRPASASSSTSTPPLFRSRWPYGITRRSPTWTRRPCR